MRTRLQNENRLPRRNLLKALLAATAGPALTAQGQAERAIIIVLILRPDGFTPSVIKAKPGPLAFQIISKTGQSSVDYRIGREAGGLAVAAMRNELELRKTNVTKETVRLTAGTYLLTAVGNPKAICRIEIAA